MTLVMVQHLLLLVSALHLYDLIHLLLYVIHHISNGKWAFRSVKVLNLFIINYFDKNSANAISFRCDIQHIKVISSESSEQNILVSLRHMRKLVHEDLFRKKGKI